MKKLLSLIGAISLTAMSGVSVVSCVVKTPSKPRFSSLTSIDPKIWNQTKKEFLASEIVPDNSEQLIAKDSYLYYTIVNSFKNPNDVEKYFDSNKIAYKASLPEPVNGQEGTNIIFLDLFISGRSSLKVQNLAITTYANKTRLPLPKENEENLAVTLTNSNDIFQTLVTFTNAYYRVKTLHPEYPEKYYFDSMYRLDLQIKNQAISVLETKYLPSFDSENKKFYESLGQQLTYLNDDFPMMNRLLLLRLDEIIAEKIVTNKNSSIRTTDLKEKITTITLGNLTITLN